MKEIEELKKRLRDIEVPFKERKSFQLGYAKSKGTEPCVLHVAGWGILPGIVEIKENKIPIKEENVQRTEIWEKRPSIR